MNAMLWTLQLLLAFLFFAGGAYKTFQVDELMKQAYSLPPAAWRALGIFEMTGALLIVLPGSGQWRSRLPVAAASALAAESLLLAAMYARYSLELTLANAMVWAVVMGALTAFVAYGRYAVRPLSH